jgi:hypothetical protein
MNSGVRLGTHHIFFQPRLDVPGSEPLPQGDGCNLMRRFAVGYHPFPQELERPPLLSPWRLTCSQSHKMGFPYVIDLLRLSGTGSVIESRIESFGIFVPNALHGATVNAEAPRYRILAHTRMRLEQQTGAGDDTHIVFSLPYDIL